MKIIPLLKLKNVCISITDCPHSSPTWVDHGIIAIRNYNLVDGKVDFSQASYVTENEYKARIRRAVPEEGDIVLSREAPIGNIGLIPPGLKCCLGQRVVLLKVDKTICYPEYLVYILMSREIQHQMKHSEGTGTTVSNLRIQHIENIEINLPDLEVQKRFLSIISPIDSLIIALSSINDNLLATAKTLFKNSLDDESISSVVISDVCSSVTDGVHNTVEDDPEGCALLLSCKNIKDGQLIIGHDERTISRQTFDKLRKRTKLAIGDILLTSVGTIGETYLILDEPDNIEFQRSVALIKPDRGKVSPEYLYLAINHVNESIINAAHGAVQQCLFINDVCSIEVPLIGKESIEKLTNSVRPLFTQINQNRKESQHLASIRDYLLPKLMSGEIDVSTLEIPN